jgi:YbbR domain-containing protein
MWLRDVIIRNFWLKLFSVALAVLIWATVSVAIRNESQDLNPLVNQPSRVVVVPVLVMSAAADVRECRVRPENVEVTVRGEKKLLDALQEKDVHAIVDLTDVEFTPTMSKRIEVTTPPGVVYTRVSPDSVQVVVPPPKAKYSPPAPAITNPGG